VKKDSIYKKKIAKITPFTFDSDVAEAFDDMAERSIPGYADMQDILGSIAGEYFQDGTNIYDLGCSTGNTTAVLLKVLSKRLPPGNPVIKALDKSSEMIEIAEKKMPGSSVEWICDDIMNVQPVNASVVIASYVIQFIPVVKRKKVLCKIYDGLCDRGILLLAEKVACPDKKLEKIISELYVDFKLGKGYSDLEIRQKAESLEGVLIPASLDENSQLLKNAGFSSVELIYKNLNFMCIMAEK
jgi:tRNA (cmo5U34)-methyltransferase